MGEDDYVPQLTITVSGSEIADEVYDELTEVRAESSLQVPDQIRLCFNDPDFELYDKDTFQIEAELEVSMTMEGSPQVISNCEITSIGMEPGRDGAMTMTVTALGRDHRLHRGIELDAYVDQTDSEIAAAIAAKVGLSADTDASSIRNAHVTQATTNHRFLTERAERIGYRWWVDGTTLYFKKKPPTTPDVAVRWGEDLIDLRVVASSASANSASDVRGWDPDQQKSFTGTATSTPSIDSIGTDATGPTAVATKSRTMASANRFQGTIVTDDTQSANDLADGMNQRASAGEVRLRGEMIGSPQLRAGATLDIQDVGTRLSGKYRVATVEHVYTASLGYRTRFASGGQEPTGIVDLLRGPTDSTAPWDARTLVIGVVSNVSDPDKPSRVKVKFPTFSDELESAWARVAGPGAGPDRGLHVLPEVDDEVLVGFEHGNPQRPIVLGGLWSSKLTPPTANTDAIKSGSIAVRRWKSRSGHSVTIDDAEAEGGDAIVVELSGGMGTFRLGKDKVLLETPVDIEVTTKKAASLTADGDVSIKGVNVTITADSKITLDCAELAATAKATASVEGATVDIKGSAKVGVDGGGLSEIKGGLVKLN